MALKGAYGKVTIRGTHAFKTTSLFDDEGYVIGPNVNETLMASHFHKSGPHRHMVGINGVHVDTHKLVIDMEAGDRTLFTSFKKGSMQNCNAIRRASLEMAAGLADLHAAGYVHLDFKPDNAVCVSVVFTVV